MSCLSLRVKSVEIPFITIDNYVELLLPIKVEDNGVIVRSYQFKRYPVSDNFKGMKSSMFALENLVDNGQIMNMKECSMNNGNIDDFTNGVIHFQNKINEHTNEN